jgi:hypothetical protein
MLCGTMTASESMGRHRYGIVLLLAIVAVVFLIVAPTGALSRALGLLIVSAMLLVVVATSRGDLTLRKTAVAAIGLVTVLVAVLAALSDVPSWVSRSGSSCAGSRACCASGG